METKNKPYVKIYENGILTNPIETNYNSGASQRKFKRGHLRIGFNKFLKHSNGLPVMLTIARTKRGFWNIIKQEPLT